MGKGDAGQQQQQQRLFPDLNPKYKPNGASPKRAKARMSNMENSFDAEMIIEKLNQFEQYMHFNDRRLQEIEVNLNKAQAKTEYRVRHFTSFISRIQFTSFYIDCNHRYFEHLCIRIRAQTDHYEVE